MKIEECESIADAVELFPAQANEALAAISTGSVALTVEGLFATAESGNAPDPYSGVEDLIVALSLDVEFIEAMVARGVAIGVSKAATPYHIGNFDPNKLAVFVRQSERQKCRIDVGNTATGSGCLIGPSLVLTAWHVINQAANGQVLVRFSQAGAPIKGSVVENLSSPCSEHELNGTPSKLEADYLNHNDVAVIQLARAEGMRVGFVGLPEAAQPLKVNSSVYLMHYPEGADQGVCVDSLRKIRNLTCRWRYAPLTGPGSSGGVCVGTNFTLAGIHQGAWGTGKRMVPANLFHDTLANAVAQDVAPKALWSLDGSLNSPLVLARDALFEALFAASQPNSRTRAIRVKRLDTSGETGLNFSLDAARQILLREPDRNVIVRLAVESNTSSLFKMIGDGLAKKGIDVPSPANVAGASADDTTLEASIIAQARELASSIEAHSCGGHKRFWFLFENAPAGLVDEVRFELEAFFAAALTHPSLRILMAGFETMPSPGPEYESAHTSHAANHVIVDYIGHFYPYDVDFLLERALRAAGVDPDPGWVVQERGQILDGLGNINQVYGFDVIHTVIDRIRDCLYPYFQIPETNP